MWHGGWLVRCAWVRCQAVPRLTCVRTRPCAGLPLITRARAPHVCSDCAHSSDTGGSSDT
eukprot:4999908-Prymnesium_polylepis.2